MPYTLGEILGEGSTAITFSAEDDSGKRVVVKRFKSPSDPDQGWQREAAALRGLTHPQIPQYIDDYEKDVDGPIGLRCISNGAAVEKLWLGRNQSVSKPVNISVSLGFQHHRRLRVPPIATVHEVNVLVVTIPYVA